MINIIAQYKVRNDKLEVVKSAINEFVNSIKKNEPDTLVYESFQMPDKISFIHFMSFRDKDAEEKHRNTAHVKKFVELLYPNCDKEPEFTKLDLISSTRK